MSNPPMIRRSSPSRQQPLSTSPTSRLHPTKNTPQISPISDLIVLGRFVLKHRVSVEKKKTTVYFIFLEGCLTGMKLHVCVCVCMCVAVIASGSCSCLHQEGGDGRASVPERARLPLQTSGVFQRLQGVQGNIPTCSCPVSVSAAPCGSAPSCWLGLINP